jgi:hypothetical protein
MPAGRRTRPSILVWVLWALAAALTAGAGVCIALINLTTEYHTDWNDLVLWGGLLAFASVGALIALRLPANRIGWLLLALGVLWGAKSLANEYAVYALFASEQPLRGATLAAWGDTWLGIAAQLLLVVYLPLWFPTGYVAGPRWRIVERLAAVGIVVAVVGFVLQPGVLGSSGEYTTSTNPIGLLQRRQVSDTVETLGIAIVTGCVVAAIVSLGRRLRASRGVERQQIKWVVYWLAIFVVAFMINALAHIFAPSYVNLALVPFILSIVAIPFVIAIAILRYHLFDIDRVINRTLVYGVATIVLGACYLLGVVVLQTVLDPLTRGSDLAVAATTLLVAAIARPARDRVQRAVDRRFYRRRYDAARVVAAFSVRLRNEVNLDTVGDELRWAVQETVQPASVTLWLRAAEPGPAHLPG